MNSGEVELEYAKLARSVARLFYSRKSNGVAAVLINLLTKHEWTKEDLLAKELGLSWRQVRKALRELEQDLLIQRVVLRDSKSHGTMTRFTSSESSQSYCCLDYKRMVDSCRLKLYQVRRYLKGEEEDKTKVEGYFCPNEDCGKTYTALESTDLEVDEETFMFLCGVCDTTLQDGNTKADDKETQKHKEMLKRQQALFEEELKPFGALLKRLQPYNPPDFGTLQEWATAQAKIREAKQNMDTEIIEQGKTDFNIEFEEDVGQKNDLTAVKQEGKAEKKELPPWMRLGYQDVKVKTEGEGIPAGQGTGAKLEGGEAGAAARATGKRSADNASQESVAKKAKVESAPAPVEPNETEDAEEDDDDVEWEDM